MPWVFEYSYGHWIKFENQQQNDFNMALIQGLKETQWLHTYNNGRKTTLYTIDFEKMIQINPDSQTTRKIKATRTHSEDETKAISWPVRCSIKKSMACHPALRHPALSQMCVQLTQCHLAQHLTRNKLAMGIESLGAVPDSDIAKKMAMCINCKRIRSERIAFC